MRGTEKDKFWKKEEADAVVKKTQKKDGFVKEAKKDTYEQIPPAPFDLTTLQTEAYRCFGISPKNTLSIAQELYISGLISYPRTSSQQLPAAIGYKKILTQLSKQAEYSALCAKLMKGKMKPHEGKKTDPAHPAIYPTGISSKKADKKLMQVYDLIARRFMATFSENSLRETATIKVDINSEVFVAKGSRTIKDGWLEFYHYSKPKDEELPKVEEKEAVKNRKITLHAEETKPPNRYTEASIVRELEKRNLGTKATRSEIVDTLFQRGYATGKAIEATKLGMKIVETLEEYSPKILDEELTRHFEEEMVEVQENKKQSEEVLKEARAILTDIISDFKPKEKTIGMQLVEATKASEKEANTVGKCPKCKEGTLMIRMGKFGRFIACSKYPDCKTTFNIPRSGFVKVTDKTCEKCTYPQLTIIRKGKTPQIVCINPDCPTKQFKTDKAGTTCPKCKEGKLVVKKSIYGGFLACDHYPQCRYTETIEQQKS